MLLFPLLLALLPSNVSAGSITPRIVNGTAVTPEEKYPYLAYVTRQNFEDGYLFRCGGSLVASDVVLTAAHCYYNTSDVQSVNETFVVFLSEYNVTDPYDDEPAYTVTDVAIHPDYDKVTTNYDYMLLKLSRPADTGKSILLDDGSSYPGVSDVGAPASVMGWGLLEDGGDRATVLMETNVAISNFTECQETYGDIVEEAVICAYEDYTDACQGDSGGPLVYSDADKDVQVGIVSKGIGCAMMDVPGVYARVDNAFPAIAAQLCAWDETSKYCENYPSATATFVPYPSQERDIPASLTAQAPTAQTSGAYEGVNAKYGVMVGLVTSAALGLITFFM